MNEQRSSDHLTKEHQLTRQPTKLPGLLWDWCPKCDANNPECGRCGGLGYFNITWFMPLYTHKHGVLNMEVT